jgi:hypothetical protein
VAEDLVGKKFGKLTVLARKPNVEHHTEWLCQCECGNQKVFNGGNLRAGQTTSCGCLRNKGSAAKRLYGWYTQNAKRRGISWDLTFEQFKEITSSKCHYTGRLPSNIIKRAGGDVYAYNGVDRIDNTKGYFLENCVPCCSEVNYAKRVMGYFDFIKLCEDITTCQRTNLLQSSKGTEVHV